MLISKKALAAAQKAVLDDLATVENRTRGLRSSIKTEAANVIAAMEKNLHEFDEMMSHSRTRMVELISATKANFEAMENAATGVVAILESSEETELEEDPAFKENDKPHTNGSKTPKLATVTG